MRDLMPKVQRNIGLVFVTKQRKSFRKLQLVYSLVLVTRLTRVNFPQTFAMADPRCGGPIRYPLSQTAGGYMPAVRAVTSSFYRLWLINVSAYRPLSAFTTWELNHRRPSDQCAAATFDPKSDFLVHEQSVPD